MSWGDDPEVETGLSAATDAVTGEVLEDEPVAKDPSAIDINTMSTGDFLALSDYQWVIVMQQIVAELGMCQRRRAELSPFYYEYKGTQERERNLTSQKSAVQTLLRTARET